MVIQTSNLKDTCTGIVRKSPRSVLLDRMVAKSVEGCILSNKEEGKWRAVFNVWVLPDVDPRKVHAPSVRKALLDYMVTEAFVRPEDRWDLGKLDTEREMAIFEEENRVRFTFNLYRSE